MILKQFQLIAALTLLLMLSDTAAVGAEHTAGKATVYADSFHGKKTANGQIYKKNEISVASNRLPLGSKVKITNKQNGKTVVAKVNDRMSKHASAAVDLSKGAAKALKANGTAQVDAKVVSKASK